jgi:hypothetical protein
MSVDTAFSAMGEMFVVMLDMLVFNLSKLHGLQQQALSLM